MMLALILPVIITATIIALTLGISFFCMEMVIRLIGRGLSSQPAPVPTIRRPINRRSAGGTHRRGYRLPGEMKIAA